MGKSTNQKEKNERKKMNVKKMSLLGVSIFGLLPMIGNAQEANQAQEANNTEIVTVTATRSERIASDAIGNQASVSGSEVTFIAPTHINEALQGIAGANISRNNGQEIINFVAFTYFYRCWRMWSVFNGDGRYSVTRSWIL